MVDSILPYLPELFGHCRANDVETLITIIINCFVIGFSA